MGGQEEGQKHDRRKRPGPQWPGRASLTGNRNPPSMEMGGSDKSCQQAPFPFLEGHSWSADQAGILTLSKAEITVAGQRRTLTGFPFKLWHPGHEHLDRYTIQLVRI